MIRLTCPGCQSKLNAKEELVGQTRKCPKCNTPVLIAAPSPEPVAAPASMPAVSAPEDAPLPHRMAPERLNRTHRYFICSRNQVIASWENNGQGWLVRAERGFVSAFRNNTLLPSQGDFKLVELKIGAEGDRLQIRGLQVFQLAQHWALLNLARGDDAILKSVTGPAGLQREQKTAVRQHIKDQFTSEIWQNAAAVRDFLSNMDHRSPGVEERD